MKDTGLVKAEFRWRDSRMVVTAPALDFIDTISGLSGLPPVPVTAASRRIGISGIGISEDEDCFQLVMDTVHLRFRLLDDVLATAGASLAPFLIRDSGFQFLHGAAVIIDGSAHLLLGPGMAGKSSLALAVWLAGGEVLADDCIVLNVQDATVEAVPRPMRIRLPDGGDPPAHIAALLAAGSGLVGRVRGEKSLFLGRHLPRMTPVGRRYPIGSIGIVERTGPNGETARCRAGKAAAITGIMRQAEYVENDPLGVLGAFEGLFKAGRIYHLRVADGEQAAASRLIGIDP